MKKRDRLIILCVCIAIIIGVGGLLYFQKDTKSAKIELKEKYTLKEIFNKIDENYSKIKTLHMTFKDIWFNIIKEGEALKSETGKCVLFNVLKGDKLKIECSGVEVLQDPKLGLIGSYEGEKSGYKYNHLINWLGGVYKMVLLLPMQFKEMAKYRVVSIKKMSRKGYYWISFLAEKDELFIDATVNMYYGTVEEINIKQNLALQDIEKNEIYVPYTINAKLKKFKNFDNIYFPTEVYVKYISESEKYVFNTEIKKIRFNKKIGKEIFALKSKNTQIVWYKDPFWVNETTLIMIKATGKKIKNIYGSTEIKDKNFYIVKRDIKTRKEIYIKHILSSKDDLYTTRFLFTGDYNKKYNLMAYAITESINNENKDLKKIIGVYILDLNTGKIKKVSNEGFLPLWSNDGKFLLWNQASEREKGINNIWLCDYRGRNKKLLIKNGFHYNWGKNDKTIVFERGWWIFGKGHYIPKGLTHRDIKGGIYVYNFNNNNISILSERGFFPCLSPDKEKIIFTDRNEKSGIYLIDLKLRKRTKLIDIKESPRIYSAFWDKSNKVLYIKVDSSIVQKCGLYRYSIEDNTFEFISNQIKFSGVYTSFIDVTDDNSYLLYKFYQHPEWDYYMWGVYDLKKGKIVLKNNFAL